MSATALRPARLSALWLTIMCGLAALAGLAWAWFAPASLWLDVRAVTIADVDEGAPIVLVVDRTIRRGGPGQFLVVARRIDPRGPVTLCQTPWIAVAYRPGAQPPDPLTLDWWTRGQLRDEHDEPCRLTPGRWEVATTWRMEPPGYPDKVIATAAEFTVRARPP